MNAVRIRKMVSPFSEKRIRKVVKAFMAFPVLPLTLSLRSSQSKNNNHNLISVMKRLWSLNFYSEARGLR